MDASLQIRAAGTVLASCSLWWSSTPALDGRRVGYVGHYRRSDSKAAASLLSAARRQLRAAGCGLAIGPVDGSTWQRYRFVTERGDRPSFALEPDNPDAYPDDFRAAGFTSLAHYVSAEESDTPHVDPRLASATQRLQQAGVRLRAFDPNRFEAELDALCDVALQSFSANLLFTPIERDSFRALYAPLQSWIDPRYVRIAEHDGRPAGFIFAIPDFAAAGAGPRAVVVKTLARLPNQRYAGLGPVMLADVRRAAHQSGIRNLVHALIRDENASLNISRRYAKEFRGYTLFGSTLQ